MKPRKTREIATNLEKKGFIPVKRDHIFYFLHVKGKKTRIRTKISHGYKEYPPTLLIQMAKQLFLSKDEFNNLIDCPLTHDKLIALLNDKGILKVNN